MSEPVEITVGAVAIRLAATTSISRTAVIAHRRLVPRIYSEQ
ncbi:hypothetical protein [Tritonibacter sp. SIMBA_163]